MADTLFQWFFFAASAFIAFGFLSIAVTTIRRERQFHALRTMPPATPRPAAGGSSSTSTDSGDTFGVQPVEPVTSMESAFETADASSDSGSDSGDSGDFGSDSGGDFSGGGGDFGGGGGGGSWS